MYNYAKIYRWDENEIAYSLIVMFVSNAEKFNYLRSLKQIYFILSRLRILISSFQYIDRNAQIRPLLTCPRARLLVYMFASVSCCVYARTCFFMPFQSTFIHSFMDTNRARLSFCFNGGGENRMKS